MHSPSQQSHRVAFFNELLAVRASKALEAHEVRNGFKQIRLPSAVVTLKDVQPRTERNFHMGKVPIMLDR